VLQTKAHCINQGLVPALEQTSRMPQLDCLWFNAADPDRRLQEVQDIVTHSLSQLCFDAKDAQAMMLWRNLIYTRLTQAQMLVVLVGAIALAVNQVKVQHCYTLAVSFCHLMPQKILM
jgi:hypothetical protein